MFFYLCVSLLLTVMSVTLDEGLTQYNLTLTYNLLHLQRLFPNKVTDFSLSFGDMIVDYYILVVNRTKHVLVCLWNFIAHETVMISLNSHERPKGRSRNSPVSDAETHLKNDLLQVVQQGGDRRKTRSWDVMSTLTWPFPTGLWGLRECWDRSGSPAHMPRRAHGVSGQSLEPWEGLLAPVVFGSSLLMQQTWLVLNMSESIRRLSGDFVFSECCCFCA